jgi:hypothetical protein
MKRLMLAWAWLSLFVWTGCDPGAAPPTSTTTPAKTPDADHGHDHEGEHADHKHAEEGHGEEGHDHVAPATFADGVQQVVALRDSIRDAFAAGDAEKADGPVHDIGHVLEDLTKLGEAAGLPADRQAEVKQAVESLFDHFERIDAKIHGGDGATYDELSAKIDEAVSQLTAAAGP